MRPPRHLLVAFAAALLVVTTGCSSDDSEPGTSLTPVAEPRPVDKDAFFADLMTAIDAQESVHLDVDTPEFGSGEVDVSYGRDGTQIQVVTDLVIAGPTMIIIADGVVYLEQSKNGKYAVVDRDDPTYGKMLSTFTEIGPHDSVAGLAAGATKVTSEGRRAVDGELLDRYVVTIDPTRSKGAFQALAGSSGIAQPLDFVLYVDGGTNLLRRVEVTSGGNLSTVSLTDWGVPVIVRVPTKSELATIEY